MSKSVEGADCKNCPLNGDLGLGPVFPKINERARLVIVGQEPGNDEVEAGEPFVGRSGRLLNRTLEEFNINRDLDCHVTNALLCMPTRRLTADEAKDAMVACRGRLHAELSIVDSRVVVGLGALALRTLTGQTNIFDWFGSPGYGTALDVKTERTKRAIPAGALVDFYKWLVVPTLHPAFCLRSPAHTPVMQTHLLRGWRFAEGKLGLWKWPKLHLEPNKAALAALRRMLKSPLLVALDVETDGVDPTCDVLRVVGLSNTVDTVSVPWNAYNTKRAGEVKGLWSYPLGQKIYETIKKILETKQLIFQNGQHDITSIETQTDIRIPDDNYIFDTLLAHAVVAPRLNHYLGHIATMEFHVPAWKSIFGATTDQKGGAKFFNRPELETRDYNAKDALVTALLHLPLAERLSAENNGDAQFNMLLRKMKVAMRMRRRGIKTDPSRFATHRKHFITKSLGAKRVLRSVAAPLGMKAANPNAHHQMHRLFFDLLKVAPKKYSEETGRPSLDEEVLSDLLYHQDERVKIAARGLLYFRRWDKLRGTYIDGLPYDKDNVVHADWKVYGARTGRWSSSPNLQNIPKPRYKTLKDGTKKVEVPGLRDIFVPRRGSYLVEADYKALELRIATLLSGDPLFLANFRDGVDPHRDTAARVFGKDPADISKDERDIAKTANYQTIYLGSAVELWKKIIIDYPNVALWTIEKAQEKWLDIHRAVYVWQQGKIRDARQRGYTECPFSGRRQYYLDGQVDPNEIANFDVQGTGADIIDPALVALSRDIDWKEDAILLQVHDALACETTNVERMAELLTKHMTTTLAYEGRTMDFPIDIKWSKESWAQMEEL